jgi:L-fucose mutarotase
MLKTKLLHPQVLEALGRAGHHSRVVIADGNYPAASTLGPNARHVSLNLMPGVVSATQALEALIAAMPIEAAYTMDYERSGPYALTQDPPIWAEYRSLLMETDTRGELKLIEKWKFYDFASAKDVVLTIQTADQRLFANLVLVTGVVKPA